MNSRRLLLVGWDAADWKIIRPLIETGRLPHFQRIVENGASGDIATLHPPLSPMLWTSICTGKRPFHHGIHGFAEPAPDGSGVRPATNLSRKTKALWNILSQNSLRSIVVGWWPSYPAEPIGGVMVSDHYHRARGPLAAGWPLPAGTVHPPELAEALAALRVHPETLDPELVERFIPLARDIDQNRDRRLAGLLRTVAEAMSIQAAAAWLMGHEDWDFAAVYFESLDHFSHGFMRYHPPQQPWIADRDFEFYHNVVPTAYEFHDELLGGLLEHITADTTVIVISDHGFHPDHLRPSSIPDIPAGPAVEHRDLGVLAMRGPGIRNRQVVRGASLLDIAPTALTLFGLPIGEDMDGRVLSEAFSDHPPVETIPSWDAVPGQDGRHPPHMSLDPVAAHEAMEQVIALGYVERPDESREVALRSCVRELRFNLAQSYQDAARHFEAYEILSDLCAEERDEQRFAARFFASCQALGKLDDMRQIVNDLDGRRRMLYENAKARIGQRKAASEHTAEPDESSGVREAPLSEDERRSLARWHALARYEPAVTDYLKAQLAIAEGRYARALELLEGIADAHLVRPGVLLETADLYARLGRASDARWVYRRALEIDPDDTRAHLGLCRIDLLRRQFAAAAGHALDALERRPQDPEAHFLLGRALVRIGEHGRAVDAFRSAIALNPNFPQAHTRLAVVLERHFGDRESAREHRRLAQAMRCPRALAPSVRETAAPAKIDLVCHANGWEMPPISECLVVVTGLPRSGTSLLMQMLAAGGMPVLSDGHRRPDEDNPRGYVELERVKRLAQDSHWLFDSVGKAVKIVVPLVSALPPGLACRVIVCERDLDEVLDSQERMLRHRNEARAPAANRRRTLKQEYQRTLERVTSGLIARPLTSVLRIEYSEVVAAAHSAADRISVFLSAGLDTQKMAAAVEPRLHRNRACPAQTHT